MAKKTFVLNTRLVKGNRWYIDYQRFNSETGETTRHRQDFSLNDIDDLTMREHVGQILCRHLEHFTRIEIPVSAAKERAGETVKAAVTFALSIKMGSAQEKTNSTYKSALNPFFEWIEKQSYAEISIHDFKGKHAQAYFDFLQTRRKYKGRTLNNYIIRMRSIWSVLVDREITEKNAFILVKSVKVEEKRRRPFTDDERRVVATVIKEKDYYLFRALLLQYYCYIRPVEIARMKFKAFNFTTGTVAIDVKKGRKPRIRYATIPKSVLHYFTDGTFNVQPANYYIFGSIEHAKCGPAPKPAHENRQYKRHLKILNQLKESGELNDIEGLSWYSWKDTGISAHATQTTPLATRDQAGHTDFQMTLTYYHAEKVNEEYRQLTDDLF